MTIIRQKLTRPALQDGGAERALSLALPRAAMEASGLDLSVTAVTSDRVATSGLARAVPEHALILTLSGPEGGKGAVILSPELTSALVEVQMTGRLSGPGLRRKPTRIDAALAMTVVEATLAGLDTALAAEADRVWAAGFRADAHLTDAEGLTLALPPGDLRLLSARLLLTGVREATVTLALPAEGRGTGPETGTRDHGQDEAFRSDLSAQVMGAEAVLHAVLCRMTVPLGAVMQLKVGEAIPLPCASVDQVQVETVGGHVVAQGRLGQNRGMRALRLQEAERKAASAEVVPLRSVG